MFLICRYKCALTSNYWFFLLVLKYEYACFCKSMMHPMFNTWTLTNSSSTFGPQQSRSFKHSKKLRLQALLLQLLIHLNSSMTICSKLICIPHQMGLIMLRLGIRLENVDSNNALVVSLFVNSWKLLFLWLYRVPQIYWEFQFSIAC